VSSLPLELTAHLAARPNERDWFPSTRMVGWGLVGRRCRDRKSRFLPPFAWIDLTFRAGASLSGGAGQPPPCSATVWLGYQGLDVRALVTRSQNCFSGESYSRGGPRLAPSVAKAWLTNRNGAYARSRARFRTSIHLRLRDTTSFGNSARMAQPRSPLQTVIFRRLGGVTCPLGVWAFGSTDQNLGKKDAR